MPALNEMYKKYRRDVEFLVVYIQEAHPTDGWQVPNNEKDNVLIAAPRSLDDRSAVAQHCVSSLGLEIPAVVDGMDNAVDRAYAAWPDRIYVVDRAGRIAYKGLPGPFGFLPDEAESAISRVVKASN